MNIILPSTQNLVISVKLNYEFCVNMIPYFKCLTSSPLYVQDLTTFLNRKWLAKF